VTVDRVMTSGVGTDAGTRWRVIDSFDQLQPYECQWDRLAVASNKPTCRPAWLRAWWDARCAPANLASRALRLVVVTKDERLVGLFPGFLVDRNSRLPELRLLGKDTFWSVEPLVSHDAPEETLALFGRALIDTPPPPVRVVLSLAPKRVEWPRELRRQWPGGPTWLRRGFRRNLLMIEGPISSEAWLAGLSRHQRADLRRCARRRAQAGVEVLCTESPQAVRDDVHALAELHHARWNRQSGWLIEGVEDTIAEAGRLLVGKGGFRLWKVVRGEEVLGAAIFARAGNASELLLTAFDPAWSRLGPGREAIVTGIRHELDAGVRSIDFGYGGFKYLQRLSNAEHPVVGYELFPADLRMPIARARLLIPHSRERLGNWRNRLARLLRATRLGSRALEVRSERRNRRSESD